MYNYKCSYNHISVYKHWNYRHFPITNRKASMDSLEEQRKVAENFVKLKLEQENMKDASLS